jgi:hypothetical protein
MLQALRYAAWRTEEREVVLARASRCWSKRARLSGFRQQKGGCGSNRAITVKIPTAPFWQRGVGGHAWG